MTRDGSTLGLQFLPRALIAPLILCYVGND